MILLSERSDGLSDFSFLLPAAVVGDCNGRSVALRYCINPALGAASLSVSQLPRSNRPPGPGELIAVVDSGLLKSVFGWVPRRKYSCHIPADIRRIVADVATREFEGRATGSYLAAKGTELLCVTAAADRAGELVPMVPGKSLTMNDCKRLLIVQNLIEDRFVERWTLDRLARAAGINRCKLVSGYKDLFGNSVAHALRSRRLEQARHHLMVSDEPIAQICYDLGYENAASFSRAFQRQYGVSPSDVRRGSPGRPCRRRNGADIMLGTSRILIAGS